MFGKPTSEVTAVAQTPPCRCHLGPGIYNVQTAVEGMDGNKRSYLLHLCGQLLCLVLIPCHVGENLISGPAQRHFPLLPKWTDMSWARYVQ